MSTCACRWAGLLKNPGSRSCLSPQTIYHSLRMRPHVVIIISNISHYFWSKFPTLISKHINTLTTTPWKRILMMTNFSNPFPLISCFVILCEIILVFPQPLAYQGLNIVTSTLRQMSSKGEGKTDHQKIDDDLSYHQLFSSSSSFFFLFFIIEKYSTSS